MRVLLGPMPVALRLQVRRLLRAAPGVSVVGHWIEGSTLEPLLRDTGAEAIVLDAPHTPPALWQACQALQGAVSGGPTAGPEAPARLHKWVVLCPPGAARLPGAAGSLLTRPDDLEAEAADGAFARQLLQALGGAGLAQPGQTTTPATPPATRSTASSAATPTATPAATLAAPAVSASGKFDLVAVGSSTGGPQALQDFFAGLARARQPLPFALLLTQHMAAGFVAPLAQSLQAHSGIPCCEAQDGMPLVPGRAYLAPGGRHLRLQLLGGQRLCRLDDGPPENYCKPSVDVMLRSLAPPAPVRVLVVILTGMGQDGLQGCQRLHAAGVPILAQDRASSVVWGMPGAVAQAGICQAVLGLDALAARVLDWAGVH